MPSRKPAILVVDPAYFSVSYIINPWMNPAAWKTNPAAHLRHARSSFAALCDMLSAAGAIVHRVAGVSGLPDMVFPANAAIVLDGRAIVARFACHERQDEEAAYQAALQPFVASGLLSEISIFPEGCFQEGAGDAIWDHTRQLFWAGYGQRSIRRAVDEIEKFFGKPAVPLHLATPEFYHLDTCFCPLSGGEVLYYPPAFSAESLTLIESHVAPEQRLIATPDDAAHFCVNAVCIDRTIVMAKATDHVREMLTDRGYNVRDVDLAPFILSGGGAYCMTLRLDRVS